MQETHIPYVDGKYSGFFIHSLLCFWPDISSYAFFICKQWYVWYKIKLTYWLDN